MSVVMILTVSGLCGNLWSGILIRGLKNCFAQLIGNVNESRLGDSFVVEPFGLITRLKGLRRF